MRQQLFFNKVYLKRTNKEALGLTFLLLIIFLKTLPKIQLTQLLKNLPNT